MNKEICINCWSDLYRRYSSKVFSWTNFDEEEWNKGLGNCPNRMIETINTSNFTAKFKLTNDPPNHCKYRLEHLVIKGS